MIWKKPSDHFQDCYFCLVNLKRYSAKQKKKITYSNLYSARRPVSFDTSMPAPLPSQDELVALADEVKEDSDKGSTPAPSTSTDSEYNSKENLKPILFFQERSNHLTRDLSLSKQKAELLTSRLEENILLQKDVVVTHHKKHNMDLSTVFTMDGT